jgi:hypothetical protein
MVVKLQRVKVGGLSGVLVFVVGRYRYAHGHGIGSMHMVDSMQNFYNTIK